MVVVVVLLVGVRRGEPSADNGRGGQPGPEDGASCSDEGHARGPGRLCGWGVVLLNESVLCPFVFVRDSGAIATWREVSS